MGLFIHVRGKLIRVAAHAAQKDEYLALVRLRTHLHTALGGLVKSMSCHSLILPLLEFTHDLDVQNNLGPLRTLVMICGSWSVSLSIFFSTAAFNCGLYFQILLLITGGGHCSGFIRLAMSSSLLCRSRTSYFKSPP